MRIKNWELSPADIKLIVNLNVKNMKHLLKEAKEFMSFGDFQPTILKNLKYVRFLSIAIDREIASNPPYMAKVGSKQVNKVRELRLQSYALIQNYLKNSGNKKKGDVK